MKFTRVTPAAGFGRRNVTPPPDFVEVGTALYEEPVVALQNDVLTTFEFGQLERAGTDNIHVVARVGFWILPVAIDMLRDDRHQLR